MAEPASPIQPERWGEDAELVALLGAQGAAGFRALFDGFPEAVGVLWALRDDDGRIVDFAFGYGNPSMLRGFRLPAATPERYTLLEALPRMRGSHAFDAYVQVCDSGEPWIHEVTYDTPFGDGYMLGTFVQRNAGEPPSTDVLEQLRATTERARELIDGVLVYACAGELRREAVALNRLLADVAEDLRPRLEKAAATLEVGELPEVDVDPRQLRRVFQNLVGNAVKFHGELPPRVEVSAMRRSPEWVVTVRDNGVGIDPDHATRIFGMFSRAGSEADGSGIGPAVCRRIVEAHGGRIWVEAANGGGSAFASPCRWERGRGEAFSGLPAFGVVRSASSWPARARWPR